MRDDARTGDGQSEIAGRVAAEPFADFRDRLVAAGVIGIDAAVDEDADRLVGHSANGRQHGVARAARARVDQQHALVADLHGDVRARADQHVDVALDGAQGRSGRRPRTELRSEAVTPTASRLPADATRSNCRSLYSGIGGFGTTSDRRVRQPVLGGEFGQLGLRTGRSRQVVRHVAFRLAGDFVDHVELAASHFLREIQHPVRAPNERLLQVHGIVDDRHDGQDVAVSREMLRHRRLRRCVRRRCAGSSRP